MTQQAPWSVKGIDPQAREAAKEAARKAGMTLGQWLNAIIADGALATGRNPAGPFVPMDSGDDALARVVERLTRLSRAHSDTALPPFGGERERDGRDLEALIFAAAEQGAQRSREAVNRTAEALDSVARWIEAAERRLNETSRLASERQEQAAAAINELLGDVAARLQEVERRIGDDQDSALRPLRSDLQRIERRLEQLSTAALNAAGTPLADEMLGPLEERLAEIVRRLDALQHGERAAEHETAGESRSTADVGRETLWADTAHEPRLPHASRFDPFDEEVGGAEEDRAEEDMAPGSFASDGLAFAAAAEQWAAPPAHERAETAHGSRLAPEENHGREEPFRMTQERLAATIAEIRDRQVVLDQSPNEEPFSVAARRFAAPDPARHGGTDSAASPADAIAQRLDLLSRKIDEALQPGPAVEDVLERLERIDSRVAALDSRSDLGRVEELVRALAERIAAAERQETGSEGFEAIEAHIDHLARRIDEVLRNRPEGALDRMAGGLEHAVRELVTHIDTFRQDTAETATRAARTAVETTLGALSLEKTALPFELGSLKQDIADLKAGHEAAERRANEALEAVHDTLERVVERLALLEEDLVFGRIGDLGKPLSERPSTAPPAPLPAIGASERVSAGGRPAPAEQRGDFGGMRAGLRDHEESPERPDVKASFIAAARRAAQAAAAETAAAVRIRAEKGGSGGRLDATIGRIRSGTRRRSMILGLAAIVVAIGAVQVVMTGALQRAFHRSSSVAALPAQQTQEPAPARQEPSDPAPVQRPTLAEAEPRRPAPAPPPEKPFGNPFAFDQQPGSITASIKPIPGDIAGNILSSAAPVEAPADDHPQLDSPIPATVLAQIPAMIGPDGLREAALAGDPAAVYELATRLAEGRGMPRDLRLATSLFQAEAESGFVPAQYRIGSHYEKGIGVQRDPALAKSWYQRAAERGNAKAMHNLAVLDAEGIDGKPDYAGAVTWFRKAAELGVRDSQYNLAILLARGLGTAQDLVQSYTWFAVAANAGDGESAVKREAIGARLSSTDLALARAAVERWRPKTPDPAVNEIPTSPEWDKPRPTTGDAGNPAKPRRAKV